MAADAVRRLQRTRLALDGLIDNQGFAATGELEAVRAILRGE